jgi:hypothetical protein
VNAFVDRPTDRAFPFELADEPWRMPFQIRLERFEVDYYKEWVVSVADPEFGLLTNVYPPRPGKRVDVWDHAGDRWGVSALEHHVSVDLERRVVEDPLGPHPAAAQVTLSLRAAPNVRPGAVTLLAGDPDLAGIHLHSKVDAYLRLVHAPDEAAFLRESATPPESDEPSFGRLELRVPGGGGTSIAVPPRPGVARAQVEGFGDVALEVIAVWKDEAEFERQLKTGSMTPLWAQSERNAAVLGDLVLERTGAEPMRLDRIIAEASGFVSQRGDESPLSEWAIRLRRTLGEEFGQFNAKLVVGPGGKAALVHRDETGVRSTPLAAGGEVAVGTSGLVLRLDRVLGPSRLETRVTAVPDDQEGEFRDDLDPGDVAAERTRQIYVSATKIRVEPPPGKGDPIEAWLTSADRWSHRFGPRREMSIALREQFGNARDYRSYVSILDDGKPTVERALVQVNDPLEHRGYKIYQMRFEPREPDFSGFLVKRDRGLPWVYVGLPLTFVGIFWMLLVDPALARRRARRRQEGLAG